MPALPVLLLTACTTAPKSSPVDWQTVNAPCHPATPGAGQTAGSGAVLLAELFRRADERAGELAAAADEARTRGLACENAYNALKNW
ncbi:hypothetical protein S96127_4431 (plasmid) [Yersinia pestis]|uniref:DUF2514 family protein n=1 Tax=Yersinia pestis TaxID=632 RepID=UPI0018A4AA8F|nr:hypothetical protein S96127_4431 [Yersinia pestis]